MHNFGFALDSAWQVLIAAAVLGAGLPALFALGMKVMAYAAGGEAETAPAGPRPLARVAGIAIFAVVIAVVVLGVAYIVASGMGKTISFEHIYPTIVDKDG